MSESASYQQAEKLVLNISTRFGDEIEETVIVDKKLYRMSIPDEQFINIFGNRKYIVCTVFGKKETHCFNERALAATCAQRLSAGGACFVAIKHEKYDSDQKPLVLLCVYFNGRMVTLNKVNQYLNRNSD